jgi:TolB protein
VAESSPTRRASDPVVIRQAYRRRLRVVALRAALIGLLVALGGIIWRFNQEGVVYETSPNWSPDSRRLVFAAYENGNVDLYVMNRNGTDRHRLTNSTAVERAPAFSPDGARIAYETDRDGNVEIYVMNGEGRDMRRLTTSRARDKQPAWSPDGRRIAFVSDRVRAPAFDLFTIDANNGTLRQLSATENYAAPVFSPDGREIAADVNGQIASVDTATLEVQALTRGPVAATSPAWSPDGRTIAFVSRRNGRAELFAMSAAGSDERRLASMPTGHIALPRWSPDGARIAFVLLGGEDPRVDALDQPSAIYVLEVGSGRLARLTR